MAAGLQNINAVATNSGNCLINHTIGLNGGNFGNGAHFTGGGGVVDSGGGNHCNNGLGNI